MFYTPKCIKRHTKGSANIVCLSFWLLALIGNQGGICKALACLHGPLTRDCIVYFACSWCLTARNRAYFGLEPQLLDVVRGEACAAASFSSKRIEIACSSCETFASK